MVHGRETQRTQVVAEAIRAEGGRADVALGELAANERLDVLANNAGYGAIGSTEDTGVADFRAQIETNLFGVINITNWLSDKPSATCITVVNARRQGDAAGCPRGGTRWATR